MAGSDADKLRDLEARINAAKAKDAPKHHSEEHYSQANVAWRMVMELVAGLGIGFAVGYGLDSLFGTKPFLMVIFIFLGLAAGVKTMMRTAEEIGAQAMQGNGSDATQDEGEERGEYDD